MTKGTNSPNPNSSKGKKAFSSSSKISKFSSSSDKALLHKVYLSTERNPNIYPTTQSNTNVGTKWRWYPGKFLNKAIKRAHAWIEARREEARKAEEAEEAERIQRLNEELAQYAREDTEKARIAKEAADKKAAEQARIEEEWRIRRAEEDAIRPLRSFTSVDGLIHLTPEQSEVLKDLTIEDFQRIISEEIYRERYGYESILGSREAYSDFGTVTFHFVVGEKTFTTNGAVELFRFLLFVDEKIGCKSVPIIISMGNIEYKFSSYFGTYLSVYSPKYDYSNVGYFQKLYEIYTPPLEPSMNGGFHSFG